MKTINSNTPTMIWHYVWSLSLSILLLFAGTTQVASSTTRALVLSGIIDEVSLEGRRIIINGNTYTLGQQLKVSTNGEIIGHEMLQPGMVVNYSMDLNTAYTHFPFIGEIIIVSPLAQHILAE